MKKLTLTGLLLKGFAFAALLTACNNDQAVMPTETSSPVSNNQKAKISALTRLTKEGDVTVQYVKAGKFFGRVSKASAESSSFYYEYVYDDNNPQGILWITRKQIKKSDGTLLGVSTYKVVNGLCVLSTEPGGGNYEYFYTPQGQLSSVKNFKNAQQVGYVNFSYNYLSATNSYRLNSLTELKNGVNFELSYTYTSIVDKYPLRNPLIVNAPSVEHGNMDTFLPIFGKFSDVLIDVIASKTHNYKQTYVTDSDGLVISKTLTVSSGNNPPVDYGTKALKYSDTWQGI